jgi:NhaA family Na+:H+ antiporter
MMGLVIGKPIGIFLFSRLLVALRIAKLPQNVNWTQVLCMGTLAGIGFTMSIFTTTLAYEEEAFRDIAKIAILFSMVISGMVSWLNFVISERIVAKVAKAIRPASPATSNIAIG